MPSKGVFVRQRRMFQKRRLSFQDISKSQSEVTLQRNDPPSSDRPTGTGTGEIGGNGICDGVSGSELQHEVMLCDFSKRHAESDTNVEPERPAIRSARPERPLCWP